MNWIRLESSCLIKSMRLQSKHLSKFRVSKNSKTYKKCLQSVETQYLGSALPKVNEQQLKIGECSRFFKIEKRAFLFPKIEVILGSVLFWPKTSCAANNKMRNSNADFLNKRRLELKGAYKHKSNMKQDIGLKNV